LLFRERGKESKKVPLTRLDKMRGRLIRSPEDWERGKGKVLDAESQAQGEKKGRGEGGRIIYS